MGAIHNCTVLTFFFAGANAARVRGRVSHIKERGSSLGRRPAAEVAAAEEEKKTTTMMRR